MFGVGGPMTRLSFTPAFTRIHHIAAKNILYRDRQVTAYAAVLVKSKTRIQADF
jgi:hypothetical protein